MSDAGRRARARPGVILVGVLLAGCGSSVRSDALVRAPAKPDDAEVLLFAREERVPACPWEVIGSVSAAPGWVEDERVVEEVRRAARELGGDAVLLAGWSDEEAEVIRFLDPRSLCDPWKGPR